MCLFRAVQVTAREGSEKCVGTEGELKAVRVLENPPTRLCLPRSTSPLAVPLRTKTTTRLCKPPQVVRRRGRRRGVVLHALRVAVYLGSSSSDMAHPPLQAINR